MAEKINYDGMLSLEHSFLKVPFQQVHKIDRLVQKTLEKELTALGPNVAEAVNRASAKSDASSEVIQAVDAAVSRLTNLKRKVLFLAVRPRS